MSEQVDVLIIGAGVAGLMAARRLETAGHSVTLLEKSRGVGGRMATRRIGPGRADQGAQFFTVRHGRFRRFVEEWQADGLVFEWSRGWSNGSVTGKKAEDGHPRYAVHGGMTAVPKHLAAGRDVRLETTITAVSPHAGGWRIEDEAGGRYQSRALLLTPPPPQSLALLDAGAVSLQRDDREQLKRIRYAPCLCGLFWVKGKVLLPEPGALQRPSAPIHWIADNQRKGISPQATLITVHGGPNFSQDYYAETDETIMDALRAALRPHLDEIAVIEEAQLKRWRYALPLTLHPERTLSAKGLPPLAFAGDAFQEPRVEGAALSGLAAAKALSQALLE